MCCLQQTGSHEASLSVLTFSHGSDPHTDRGVPGAFRRDEPQRRDHSQCLAGGEQRVHRIARRLQPRAALRRLLDGLHRRLVQPGGDPKPGQTYKMTKEKKVIKQIKPNNKKKKKKKKKKRKGGWGFSIDLIGNKLKWGYCPRKKKKKKKK
eukprot:TRINITY_DN87917_c0_g1_i1.p2 TRINITY_DN87917_c0_g1~~TRINITY_DN87917_c0_g1_i1.p2  ORF type:complete len:151 (+),score=12.84 TRINITY_DN87917_c0_g1_i1:119-571(+)